MASKSYRCSVKPFGGVPPHQGFTNLSVMRSDSPMACVCACSVAGPAISGGRRCTLMSSGVALHIERHALAAHDAGRRIPALHIGGVSPTCLPCLMEPDIECRSPPDFAVGGRADAMSRVCNGRRKRCCQRRTPAPQLQRFAEGSLPGARREPCARPRRAARQFSGSCRRFAAIPSNASRRNFGGM